MELTKKQLEGLKEQLQELNEELAEIVAKEDRKQRFADLHEFFTKPYTVETTLISLKLHSNPVFDDFRALTKETLRILDEMLEKRKIQNNVK